MDYHFIHTEYGYCNWDFAEREKSALIFGLYVEPSYRGCGNARKLFKYVIKEIRESGYDGEILIEVDPTEVLVDPIRLAEFYHSLGLTVICLEKRVDN